MVHRLLHEEGIFVGGSAGLNVAGAYQLAKKLGEHFCSVSFMLTTFRFAVSMSAGKEVG